MAFTQEGRFLTIETPLGADVLLLDSFQGREEMSHLYEFDLEMLSHEKNISAADIVGKSVAFGPHSADGAVRPFGGFVRRFVAGGLDPNGFRRYHAQVVPWLWFLTKRSDCRIFQNKTVVEIIEKVFNDAGFEAFDTSGITGSYPSYEYCVQYRETDFALVSRLLEEEGIFYFFRFEKDRQVMVLADSKVAYVDCPTSQIEFTESTPSREQVSQWQHRYEFVSGKWSHTDFNFTTPDTKLFADSPTVVSLPGVSAHERYEYPGTYLEKGHGEGKVKARMEAEEATHDVVYGEGGCFTFHLGGKFELTHHQFDSEDGATRVLTAIEHSAGEGSYSQSGEQTGPTYTNRFRCVPADVLYRPTRHTPRPVVHGPQTAVVVGPSGDEIYTDKYGRIKVQFHWDREGKHDENSSCWIRVSQSTAGKKWGAQTLPRVNQEVVVEFLDGDPDRPLVTGAVYNANTMPTYELPANKTQSGIKSRSSKDGATDAFNELRFEDKKGSEHIFLHAQKDEHHRVVNDRLEHVGQDEHRTVARHRKEKIEGDHHSTLAGDRYSSIAGSQNQKVAADRKEKIGGEDSLEVSGAQAIKLGGDQDLKVGANLKIKADGSIHRQAGMDVQEKIGMSYAADAGMEIHLKAGMNVVIEAGLGVTLKCGSNFISLNPAGVALSGTMVQINSGGSPGSGAGCSPENPGVPKAPDAPEEPVEPMGKVAAAKGDKAPKAERQSESADARYTAIENAEPTAQAATQQAASETGRPFCET